MRHRNTRIPAIIAVLFVVAVFAIVAIRFIEQGGTSQSLLPGLSQTGEAGGNGTHGDQTTDADGTTADALAEGCPAEPVQIADPVRVKLIGHGMELPMISLGLDASGAAPATPPDNAGYTVAWFNQGPLIGSTVGKAVLSSHTFRYGGALGNQLNNGLLNPGDVVMIIGSDGSSACYRYSGSTHVMVADYDNTSDILYDQIGDPKFALIVCSDYDSSGEALGRMIYYGDLIRG